MYKTKDQEGRKREKKRRSWGSRRSSYRQGIRQRRSKQATVQMELPGKVRADGTSRQGACRWNFPAGCVTCARYATRQWQSKQATVQMELPDKVRDLCQICNWARTVTSNLDCSRGEDLWSNILLSEQIKLLSLLFLLLLHSESCFELTNSYFLQISLYNHLCKACLNLLKTFRRRVLFLHPNSVTKRNECYRSFSLGRGRSVRCLGGGGGGGGLV